MADSKDEDINEIEEEQPDEVVVLDEEGGDDDDTNDAEQEQEESNGGNQYDTRMETDDKTISTPGDGTWVDIIEQEKDEKLYGELKKIGKLINSIQKGREIRDLAVKNRVTVFPVYPRDLAESYFEDLLKKCSISTIKFHSMMDKDGEMECKGLLEMTFSRHSDAKEQAEELAKYRDDIKVNFLSERKSYEDFLESWKKLSGRPDSTDSNNKLTLFAPSLPESVTDEELWDLLPQAKEIWLMPGSPRQHAYIKFQSEEILKSSIEQLKTRGPPREDFNFCRLVRFYDVARVDLQFGGPLRGKDARGQAGFRHSATETAKERNTNAMRNRNRPRPRNLNRDAKIANGAANSAKTAGDKAQDKPAVEKGPSKSPSSGGGIANKPKGRLNKPQENRNRPMGRDRPDRGGNLSNRGGNQGNRGGNQGNRGGNLSNRGGIQGNRGRRGNYQNQRNRVVDRARKNLQSNRGRRGDQQSILGEPPRGLRSPVGPRNRPLESSLNQLARPMGPPMMDERQQGLQVLDNLLSTLGNLSGGPSRNPIESLASALAPPRPLMTGGGMDDRRDRGMSGDRGRHEERRQSRGMSPPKRMHSPQDLSGGKRRRQNQPQTQRSRSSGGRDEYRPTSHSDNRDSFRLSPRRDDLYRTIDHDDRGGRSYDSLRSMDNYGSSLGGLSSSMTRDSYGGGIDSSPSSSRIESEYTRMMDQLDNRGRQDSYRSSYY